MGTICYNENMRRDKKDATVQFRISKKEKRDWEKAAEDKNFDELSSFIRVVMRKYLESK